jgi:hypothetical protein
MLGTASLAAKSPGLEAIARASSALDDQSPADVARDELYWGQIQQAFALDRTLINLNTGHHCSQPTIVMNAVKRYLDMQNQAPVYYQGVRVTPNIYTTVEEIDTFAAAMEELLKQ